jgi:hypothetical protein
VQSRRLGGLALVLAATLVAIVPAHRVAAAGESLRIEPPAQAVAEGATFTAKVIQSTSIPSGGTQVTLVFDPAMVQVVSVRWGEPFATAPILLPSDMQAAVDAANTSGRLATVAAAFLPPGNVPAGDADFLVIELRAVGCGETELGLPVGPADAQMLDGREGTYGQPVEVSTSPGRVSLCAAAPGETPPVTGAGSPAPGAPSDDTTGTPADGLPLLPLALVAGAGVVIVAGAWWALRRPGRGPADGGSS